MEGNSAKKSISLETLVIQNITNVNDLKSKLNEVINTGSEYKYDILSCIKSLLKSGNHDLTLLSIQAIAELSKCEDKRETYAVKDIIEPILTLINTEVSPEKSELVRQCCRALGNLCYDCDSGRKVILESNGVPILIMTLEKSVETIDIKLLASKALLNFMIGGKEMAEAVLKTDIIKVLTKILEIELSKEDLNDDMVSTCLLILSVVNDNVPEYLFDAEVNLTVLKLLKESASLEVTELCLDHLHTQAEHDSVKTLIAKAGGVQLVCSRLEMIVGLESSEEVSAVVKQACDLIVIVLTGDEAMDLLFSDGTGPVYTTVVRWLGSGSPVLLAAGVLCVGNFARRDLHCTRLMEEGLLDRLLDLFEQYHDNSTLDEATTTKLEHAILSAVRNLLVPECNRRAPPASRAAALLAAALPAVRAHHVAYKLMGAARMLAKEESISASLAQDRLFLGAVSSWGARAQYAGAAGEAPRLIATVVAGRPSRDIVQVEGCVSCLVSTLVVSHSVMQNEAILALTLLAAHAQDQKTNEYNYDESFTKQLVQSEIGKHVSVLIDTNCAKMPQEVAENLIAFLELTCKKNEILSDYKEAKVADALKKIVDARSDFTEAVRNRMLEVLKVLNDVSE